MPKKLSSVLGIDIGSRQIKIAEVKIQGKEPAITALGMAETPEGAVDHTGVYDTESVSKVLKDLIASSGATVPAAVVSIAGQASVLVRTLEVPKMNPTELKEHMQWEINRNIPFAESTIVSDYKAFDPADPSAQNLDVVMAISPQSAVDTLVGIVKKAGKQPAAIDVEPLGIARSLAVSHGSELQDKTVCVVDIGHKTTSINMYRNGQLLMPRQVPLGGENFTRSIADNLGVDVAEAENLKCNSCTIPESAGVPTMGASPFAAPEETQGFQPYNPFADDALLGEGAGGGAEANPFMDPSAPQPYMAGGPAAPEPYVAGGPAAPEPYVAGGPASTPPYAPSGPEAGSESQAPFGSEAQGSGGASSMPAPADDPEKVRVFNALAATLDEFLSEVRRSIDYFRSKGGDVTQVILCGGGSRLDGLPAFLSKTLGIPCSVYDPLKGLPMSAKRLEPGLIENCKPDFAIAVGNGLHICFD